MIITFKELEKLRTELMGKKIIFAGGTFDLLHKGHVNYLANLKNMGDVVVIAISSDKRVKQRKGTLRPILSESERLFLTDSIRYVDYALLSPSLIKDGEVPTIRIIKKLKPDVFVSADKKWLHFSNEIPITTKLKIVTRDRINSTTKIINRIIKRYSGRKGNV